MQYREINQHHTPAFISVISLFLSDILSIYITYNILISKYDVNIANFNLVILCVAIMGMIYLLKRYDPTPNLSIGYEIKVLLQLFYSFGITIIIYNILFTSITIIEAQLQLIILHIFILLNITFRLFIRSIQKYILKIGFGGRKTIIYGDREDVLHILDKIIKQPTLGYKIIGYFNENPNKNISRYCNYLGRSEDIETFIQNNKVHELIIAIKNHKHDKLLRIIGRYNMYDICIKIVPDMYEAITGQVKINTIRGLPLLDINSDIITEFQEIYKRAGDLLISIFGILFLLPLHIIISLLVFFDSKGKLFYKQKRVGLNGKEFTLLKYRSMYSGSEDKTGPIWSAKEDPRITKIGKILRKYHIDEIPQLLNVFMGHMSIIGPRPERPEIIKNLIKKVPYYSRRLKVKPGLTGWAQIKGVYDKDISDVKSKLKLDFYYIENISILLDLKIIFLTLFIVIKGQGQ